jgi:hypothetical protein
VCCCEGSKSTRGSGEVFHPSGRQDCISCCASMLYLNLYTLVPGLYTLVPGLYTLVLGLYTLVLGWYRSTELRRSQANGNGDCVRAVESPNRVHGGACLVQPNDAIVVSVRHNYNPTPTHSNANWLCVPDASITKLPPLSSQTTRLPLVSATATTLAPTATPSE